MLRINSQATSFIPSARPQAATNMQVELLTKATQPRVGDSWQETIGAALFQPSKKELVTLLKGKTSQQLAATRKLYEAQNNVRLEDVIARNFEDADKVELQALAQFGRLRDCDALESALVDDQNEQIFRVIKRRTAGEMASTRSEYLTTHHKQLDLEVSKTLEGKDKEIAKVLLAGEPETRPGESPQSLAKRQGEYISKQLEISMRPEMSLGGFQPANPKRVLDALHDHSPEALAQAGKIYREATGNDLAEDLKSNLTGANEEIALAYLDDGKEMPIEKLRRAFDGNNDEDLIRRTLRDLTPELRKDLVSNHPEEVKRLFEQLNSEEKVEMSALLAKGKLDNADHLKVAVADGGDKGIVRALKAMKPEERKALAGDQNRLKATLEELDSDEQVEVKRLLESGRMSAVAEFRHAESADEAYRAAAWAKQTGQTEELALMEAFGSHVGLSRERFQAHLAKGELSAAERVALENDDDRLKATLRHMSAEELKEVSHSSKAVDRLDDELDKKSMLEARELLARGPRSVGDSMRHAVAEDDEKRINELLSSIQNDGQRNELLSQYRDGSRCELLNDLRKVLGSDDLRKAENALRGSVGGAQDVNDRVRQDMFADRDDNGLSSTVSNGLLDTFSSSGKNMDDQAREAEAVVRASRRTGDVSLDVLRNKEASFQDSREVMHVERQKIASIAVSAVTAAMTAGLGGLSLSSTLLGNLLRTSWLVRGTAVAGAAGVRVGSEKLFRGNDFGTAQDIRKAGLSGAADGVSALTGGLLGRAVAASQTGKAAQITGSLVKDAWGGGLSALSDPNFINSRDGVASLAIGFLGGGSAGGASSALKAFIPTHRMVTKTVNFVAHTLTDIGLSAGTTELRGTLVNQVY